MKDTDKIASFLADEESGFIYRKRVAYNETGDFGAIEEIVDRYLPKLKNVRYYPGIEVEIPERLKDRKRIVIFGSGANGSIVRNLLASHGTEAVCYVDNNQDKWGGKRMALK